MAISPDLRLKGILRGILYGVFALASGLLLVYTGWQGWSAGEMMVSWWGGQPFLAKAVGPTSTDFWIEVWFFVLSGCAAVLLGIVGMVTLFFGSPERRENSISLFSRHKLGAWSGKAPGWLVATVILLLVGAILYPLIRGAS